MLKRLIFPTLAACAVFMPLSARADVARDVISHVQQQVQQGVSQVQHGVMGFFSILTPEAAPIVRESRSVVAPALAAAPVDLSRLDLPGLPTALPEPSVETPLHKLFCVEYARTVSGLAIFGDAKFWWARAKNLYARLELPAEDAVMVFSGSKRLRHGHVAVVTNIVSPRVIRVDQANWENHGEIDHATPVLDVSRDNDWSKVRVWDIRSRTYGAHVYAVSGFIAKGLVRQASAD